MCPRGYMPDSDRNGRLTYCSLQSNIDSCAPGATCMASTDERTFLCCRRNARSHCPNPSLLGEISSNIQHCDPFNPKSCFGAGLICMQSSIDRRLHVCCPQSCPIGYTLPRNRVIECLNSNDCPMNSMCMDSSANGQKLCCERGTDYGPPFSQQQHCPRGSRLNNGQLVMCTGNRKCSFGAFCVTSLTNPSLKICCSFEPLSLTCPMGFTLSGNGQYPRQCDRMMPQQSCDFDETCVSAIGAENIDICCKSGRSINNAQEECPFGHLLLEDRVTYCDGNPGICRMRGGKCMPSTRSSRDVCCVSRNSHNSQYTCPRGMNPYMSGNKYYYFCTTTRECPEDTTCLSSITDPSVSLCCSRSMFSPILSDACISPGNILCDPAVKSTCPTGHKCVASNSPLKSFCCQVSRTSEPICASGNRLFLDLNNNYIKCGGQSMSGCPKGTRCELAVTDDSSNEIKVCCQQGSPTCPAKFVLNQAHQDVKCDINSCEAPNLCLPSQEDQSRLICCSPLDDVDVCPYGKQPTLKSGYYKECADDLTCDENMDSCHLSGVLRKHICCGRTTKVQFSDVCLLNAQSLYISGKLQFCTKPGSYCENGFECVFSRNLNRAVCCRREKQSLKQWRCVSGRSPYPSSDDPQVCNPSTPLCPSGTACELSSQQNQYICCDLDFRKPQCPYGLEPFMDGSVVRKCDTFDQGPLSICPKRYSCMKSDINNVEICCQPTEDTGCRNSNDEPYMVDERPLNCTANPYICPSSYVCEPSANHHSLICCRQSIQLRSDICPDKSPAYRINDEVVYCDLDEDCPRRFKCQEHRGNRRLSVCCPTSVNSVSKVNALDANSFCRDGQLPEIFEGEDS